MRNGVCAKCLSQEIYTHTSKERAIMLGALGLVVTPVQLYVCAECGYTEEYILNEDFLNKVRVKWARVTEEPVPTEES